MSYTILGPPGTGKTHQLCQIISKYEEDEVIICSLTRAAAKEIAKRAGREPSHQVGTLHSVCYQALGRPGMPDINKFNTEYGYQVKTKKEMQTEFDPDDILQEYYLWRTMNEETEWPEYIQEFANKWEVFKQLTGTVDYLDMIVRAPSKPPGSPSLIVFDEAQDATAMELAVIKQWSQWVPTVIAGDDDQALYEWRGACLKSFYDFSEDFEVLSQSYRLPRTVLEYSQRWINQLGNRRWEKNFNSTEDDGLVERIGATTKYPDEAIDLASSLEGSTMILTTCNYMLKNVIKQLRERVIPFCNPWKTNNGAWNPLKKSTGNILRSWISLSEFGVPQTWEEIASISRCLKYDGVFKRGAKTELSRMGKNSAPCDLDSVFTEDGLQAITNGDIQFFTENIIDSRKSMNFQLELVNKYGVGIYENLPKIIVGTINSVKGGQADNVILFPDMSQAAMSGFVDSADPAIRLFYVGMTRTKSNLYLAHSNGFSVSWI